MTLKDKLNIFKADIEKYNGKDSIARLMPDSIGLETDELPQTDVLGDPLGEISDVEDVMLEDADIYEIDLASGKVVIWASPDSEVGIVFSVTYDPKQDLFIYNHDTVIDTAYAGKQIALTNADIEALLA